MNTNSVEQLLSIVLAQSIPDQARICDALLKSLERWDESERTLGAIDEALRECPTDTKLHAFVEHVEAKLAPTQRSV